jgi:phosphoribosylformylglycinamidine cyclo-ligase
VSEFTYRKAGVDIDEGDRFVDLIAPRVKRTFRPEVLTGLGSFGALFRLDVKKYRDPILVSGTDGVGTKLKIAFLTGVHDTVGIDLVAMCVNDIITCGAEPLFFLDYFATGKLKADDAVRVVDGMVRGCEEAGCALIGGETAEMPGFYAEGEYDLAGFAVGAVERAEIIDGSAVAEGDVVIGLASSGLHSNGYSLVRRVLLDHAGLSLSQQMPELGSTLGEELLRPTNIYARAVRALAPVRDAVAGMAHITGGGLPGNLPRALPPGYLAVLREDAWPVQPIFALIERLGNVPREDMRRTFNMGIGYALVAKAGREREVLDLLGNIGYDVTVIGHVRRKKEGESEVLYGQD